MAETSSVAKLFTEQLGGGALCIGPSTCPIARRISSAVSAAFTVPLSELQAGTRRTAPVALARQSAMYLAHVAFRMNYTEVGLAFGRARTTAARACSCIEDRREEPGLDAILAGIEYALRRDAAQRAAA